MIDTFETYFVESSESHAPIATTTLLGIGWSSAILWLVSNALHLWIVNATLWANASKVLAIFGTVLISYVGMRLWVFVSKTPTDVGREK